MADAEYCRKRYRAVLVGLPVPEPTDSITSRMQIFGASLDLINDWADKILAMSSFADHHISVEIYEQKEVLIERRLPKVRKGEEPK